MTNATTTAEIQTYLDAVRWSLDDLPADDRAELIEDLELHLAEVAAGDETAGRSLAAVLGPPDDYAAELRAAAGLPPRSTIDQDATDGLWSALAARATRSGPGRFAAALWRHPATVETRAFASQLQPAWWVLRGYLLVALPAWWRADSSDDFPIPSVLGSQVFGALVVAAAVVLSVRVGRGDVRLPLVRPAVVNAAIVVAALVLLPHTDSRLLRPTYVSSSQPQPYPSAELVSRYGPVTNIHPYGADGKPLEGVLLFDQDGRPLRVADQEWWPDGCYRIADHPRAADGVQVDFAYPRRYVVASSNMAPQGAPPARECDVGVPARPPVPLPTFPAEVAPPAG